MPHSFEAETDGTTRRSRNQAPNYAEHVNLPNNSCMHATRPQPVPGKINIKPCDLTHEMHGPNPFRTCVVVDKFCDDGCERVLHLHVYNVSSPIPIPKTYADTQASPMKKRWDDSMSKEIGEYIYSPFIISINILCSDETFQCISWNCIMETLSVKICQKWSAALFPA